MNFTPDLLEMAMTRLGIAAGQLKNISSETKKALLKLLMGAITSPDADAYLRERLGWIDERENGPAPAPPPPPRPARPAPAERAQTFRQPYGARRVDDGKRRR